MPRKKVVLEVPEESDGSASYLKSDRADDFSGGAVCRIIGDFAVTCGFRGTGYASQPDVFTPAIRLGSRCLSEGSAGTLMGGGAGR